MVEVYKLTLKFIYVNNDLKNNYIIYTITLQITPVVVRESLQ